MSKFDIRNRHGEKCNICDTTELASIQLHHNSYGSGEYFATFITHCGLPIDGYWDDGLLTKEESDSIIKLMLRAKHRLDRKIREERKSEQD